MRAETTRKNTVVGDEKAARDSPNPSEFGRDPHGAEQMQNSDEGCDWLQPMEADH